MQEMVAQKTFDQMLSAKKQQLIDRTR